MEMSQLYAIFCFAGSTACQGVGMAGVDYIAIAVLIVLAVWAVAKNFPRNKL
jgi:hypothetical protein